MYLVVECTTTSAPRASGCCSRGRGRCCPPPPAHPPRGRRWQWRGYPPPAATGWRGSRPIPVQAFAPARRPERPRLPDRQIAPGSGPWPPDTRTGARCRRSSRGGDQQIPALSSAVVTRWMAPMPVPVTTAPAPLPAPPARPPDWCGSDCRSGHNRIDGARQSRQRCSCWRGRWGHHGTVLLVCLNPGANRQGGLVGHITLLDVSLHAGILLPRAIPPLRAHGQPHYASLKEPSTLPDV